MNIPSIKRFGTTSLFVLSFTILMATFASAQNAEAEHCHNGPRTSPPVLCSGDAWVGGAANATKAQYDEGDSVPTRAFRTDFIAGPTPLTITLRYDTTKSGLHAYDFLTTWDRSYPGDPCSDVAGCDPSDVMTFPIPDDPDHTADNALLAADKLFTMYGGTITNAVFLPLEGDYAGDSTRAIQITYTADSSTVVLAWGAHIATRVFWGLGNSAGNIQGSPYHQDVGGHQLALSAGAVQFPAVIWIRKSVSLFFGGDVSSNSFQFTAPSTYLNSSTDEPITSFSLVDSVAGADPDWLNAANIQKGKTSAFLTPLVFTELQETGWDVLSVVCEQFDAGFGDDLAGVTMDTNPGDAGPPFVPATATLTVRDGAGVRCEFTNGQLAPTAADVFLEGRAVGTNGRGLSGINVTLTDINTGQRKTAVTNTFGYFKFEDLEIGYVYILSAFNKRYTFEDQTLVLTSNVTGVTMVGTPR